MFLMFNLNRPNIFPVKDIGLLRAISKNYKSIYPVVEVEYYRKYFSNNLIRLTLDFNIQYKSVSSKNKFKSFYLVLESKLPDKSTYNEKVNDFKLFGTSNESFSKYKEAINVAVLNSRK